MIPDRYVPKKISQISRNDKKVAVVGRVIDSTVASFILEDETGKIEVFFDEQDVASRERVDNDKIMRAFCTLVDEQLKANVVQDMTGVDLNLLKTVDELYSKAGV